MSHCHWIACICIQSIFLESHLLSTTNISYTLYKRWKEFFRSSLHMKYLDVDFFSIFSFLIILAKHFSLFLSFIYVKTIKYITIRCVISMCICEFVDIQNLNQSKKKISTHCVMYVCSFITIRIFLSFSLETIRNTNYYNYWVTQELEKSFETSSSLSAYLNPFTV